MKKLYFAPKMEIVEICSNISLLAGSLGSDSLPNADLDDVIPGSGQDADAPGMNFDQF